MKRCMEHHRHHKISVQVDCKVLRSGGLTGATWPMASQHIQPTGFVLVCLWLSINLKPRL
jgi:hypothetical protein